MLSFKFLIVAMIAAILWQMFELWKLGRQLAVRRDDYTISRHRGTVACVGCLTLITVVMLEVIVRTSATPAAVPTALLWFHFAVDALLVIVFLSIIFRFTGLHRPLVHRVLAYGFYVIYAAVIGSGSVLLYNF